MQVMEVMEVQRKQMGTTLLWLSSVGLKQRFIIKQYHFISI